jgi:DNA-binding NarL/FixJ family response regulator
MKNKLRVYLADDHTVVRKAMVRLLKTFARVAEVEDASDGNGIIGLVEKKEPDAVILDVEMPVMGGIEAAKYICEHYPEIKILMLTVHTEEIFVARLMDAGVHGFLSKTASPDEVEKALYSIIDKDFYKNEIVDKVLSKTHKEHRQDGYSKLSSREVEILLLICQELAPGEISERLQISEKTFFNHRANILMKTESRNNVGLVKFAYEHGLVGAGK